MTAGGVHPQPDETKSRRVDPALLAQLDGLMAKGGIDAVVERLKNDGGAIGGVADRKCCDCSHWFDGGFAAGGGYCRSPKFLEFARQFLHPEIGGEAPYAQMDCWQMRSIASLCGQYGKWFEPKSAP